MYKSVTTLPALSPRTAGIGLMSRAAVHYLAADPLLASAACDSSVAAADEFRHMVSALHDRNIEVWLMVGRQCVLPVGWQKALLSACCPLTLLRHATPAHRAVAPHAPPQVDLAFTAEGTDADPHTLSLRGLDNKAFYRGNGVRALHCAAAWCTVS